MLKCHKDRELTAALGKRVRITFFDGDVQEGILKLDDIKQLYSLDNGQYELVFYKTHVKRFEVIGNG